MFKYIITFDYDFDEDDIDHGDLDVEILDIDTTDLEEEFKKVEDVKKFEKWYNADAKNKIVINAIEIKGYDDNAVINIECENEIKDKEDFAEELMDYLYEVDIQPKVTFHLFGTESEIIWNPILQGPGEKSYVVDEDGEQRISQYKNLVIKEVY